MLKISSIYDRFYNNNTSSKGMPFILLPGRFELTAVGVCHFSCYTKRMLFYKTLVSSFTCGICHLIFIKVVTSGNSKNSPNIFKLPSNISVLS